MKMITNRLIGLHVRLQQGLKDVATAVEKFNVPVVQSFLLNERGGYVLCSPRIVQRFVQVKESLKFTYFVHAAYWSNLTNIDSKEFISLCKEAAIAVDLHSDGLVVHVGATKAGLSKHDQALYVAQGINELLYQVEGIQLFLENGPHAGRNFGGDLTDFIALYDLVEKKERIKFCIDTAHAFVYGYDLKNPMKLQEFFDIINHDIFVSNIGLLHLNDTLQSCASQIDKHDIAGQGLLGQSILQTIMHDTAVRDSYIILELPGSCDDEQMKQVLQQVNSWNQ